MNEASQKGSYKIPNRYDTLRLLDTFYCSIIKREDEKRVTEQAWDNPKFVEDSVRDLANTLKNEPRIVWFRCSSENFESIHNHNAHAEIEFDKALG